MHGISPAVTGSTNAVIVELLRSRLDFEAERYSLSHIRSVYEALHRDLSPFGPPFEARATR
jgi:hypothetical protein